MVQTVLYWCSAVEAKEVTKLAGIERKTLKRLTIGNFRLDAFCVSSRANKNGPSMKKVTAYVILQHV